jgi:hypothetical protein
MCLWFVNDVMGCLASRFVSADSFVSFLSVSQGLRLFTVCYTAAFRLSSQSHYICDSLHIVPSCHGSLNVSFPGPFCLYAPGHVCLRECMNSSVVFRFAWKCLESLCEKIIYSRTHGSSVTVSTYGMRVSTVRLNKSTAEYNDGVVRTFILILRPDGSSLPGRGYRSTRARARRGASCKSHMMMYVTVCICKEVTNPLHKYTPCMRVAVRNFRSPSFSLALHRVFPPPAPSQW